jgi:hypothetical protein
MRTAQCGHLGDLGAEDCPQPHHRGGGSGSSRLAAMIPEKVRRRGHDQVLNIIGLDVAIGSRTLAKSVAESLEGEPVRSGPSANPRSPTLWQVLHYRSNTLAPRPASPLVRRTAR